MGGDGIRGPVGCVLAKQQTLEEQMGMGGSSQGVELEESCHRTQSQQVKVTRTRRPSMWKSQLSIHENISSKTKKHPLDNFSKYFLSGPSP